MKAERNKLSMIGAIACVAMVGLMACGDSDSEGDSANNTTGTNGGTSTNSGTSSGTNSGTTFAVDCQALSALFYTEDNGPQSDWSGFWECYQETNGCSAASCTWQESDLPDYVRNDDCAAGAAESCTINGAQVAHCATVTQAGSVQLACEADGSITVTPNGLPDHTIESYLSKGELPPLLGSSAQNTAWSFTSTPVYNDEVSLFSNAGNTPGLMVNGVALFNQFAGNGALAVEDEVVDDCGGHPANSQYHYHSMPACGRLVDQRYGQEGAAHSGLIGLVVDGFPIFGPYGYATADDASSAVVRMKSCYTRQDNCADPQASCYSFDQDAFDRGDCHLDRCNGRITAVPDDLKAALGDTIYAYYLTLGDGGAPSFPYVPYCFRGDAATGGGGGGGGGDNNGGGGGPTSCTTDAECDGACPPDSQGCVCVEAGPMGSVCSPTCSTDADCPTTPMGQLTCNAGVCTP